MDKVTRRRRQGFTLIELLVVIAIMMIMMGIAVVGFVDWGRGTGLRTAVLNFKNTFSHARQHAITHRVRTQFHYGNLAPPGPTPPGTPPWRGYYYVTTTDGGVIGTTNVLPEGVIISNAWPVSVGPFEDVLVEFRLDGACSLDADGDGSSADEWAFGSFRNVYLLEGGRSAVTTNYLAAHLQMFRAQGSIRRIDDD